MARKVGLAHLRPHEPLVRDQHRVLQRAGEKLQIRESVFLEQRARELGDRKIEARELARELEDGGCRRLVLESTGIAYERGIDANRRVARQREPEPVDQSPDQHPAGGRVGVDHVDAAVALVRDVMVDDDELVRGLGRRFEVAEAGQ